MTDTVRHVDFRPRTAIVTKRGTYILPPGAVGVPIEERYPGRAVPEALKGMTIWMTEDGPVMVRPEEVRKNER